MATETLVTYYQSVSFREVRSHHLPVPLHHVRADRGHRGQRHLLVYCEWAALWAHLRVDGDGVPLLVPLPVQAEGRVRPGGGGVPRLPDSLLLRAPGAVPGVPRAQEPRLRPGDRLGCQHGSAEARCRRRHGDGGAGHAARHD